MAFTTDSCHQKLFTILTDVAALADKNLDDVSFDAKVILQDF
jgi:hypothetical protein